MSYTAMGKIFASFLLVTGLSGGLAFAAADEAKLDSGLVKGAGSTPFITRTWLRL